MNKEEIKHIANRSCRKLKVHLETIVPGFEPESIHQFRVEYKKLRAFLRMISGPPELFAGMKIPKNLKTTYRLAGAIRDLQLQQIRIADATTGYPAKPAAYLHLLRHEINRLKSEITEYLLESTAEENEKKLDSALPASFPEDGLLHFARYKWNHVSSVIASGHFSDENIHAVRKHIKDIFYNLKNAKDISPEVILLTIRKGKTESYFDQLLEELGNFQDKCTATRLLNETWLTKVDAYSRLVLCQVRKEWLHEKDKIKERLIAKLNADLSETIFVL